MAEPTFEEAAVYLPKWLSPTEQKGLFEEIRRFPEGFNYFDLTATHRGSLLQGDGWQGLVAINFNSLEKKSIKGVVISNSCDVDIDNEHDLDPNVLFVPLLRLSSYEKLLRGNGKSDQQIAAKLDEIKKQRVTSIFYFPACSGVIEESILVLDDVHRHPLSDFVKVDKAKLFTLTQAAWWLFLMKMSIHFHRVNEKVHRYIDVTSPGITQASSV